MHFVGPDQLHGFEERLTTDIYPADFGWAPDWDPPGRAHPGGTTTCRSVPAAGAAESHQPARISTTRWPSRPSRAAHDHLPRRRPRPCCLTVSFTHPHDPYVDPPALLGPLRRQRHPLTPQHPAQVELDPHSQRLLKVYDLWRRCPSATRSAMRAAPISRSLSYVDEQGRRAPRGASTAPAWPTTPSSSFSADHGDMLGERGLWFKMRCLKWPPACRCWQCARPVCGGPR